MGSPKLEPGTSQPAGRVSYPGLNTLAPITKISRLDGSATVFSTKKRCARQGAKFLSSLAIPLRCRRGRRLPSVYVHSASMCSLRWCQKKKRCAAEESSSCKVLPLPYAAGARDISQDICWHDCEVHEPPAERVAKNHVLPSQNMLRQSDLRGLEHLVRLWLSFS